MAEEVEEYERIRAVVDCGELTIVSKLKGNPVEARVRHDEDVEGWSDRDIIRCVRDMLDLTDDDMKVVKVEYR